MEKFKFLKFLVQKSVPQNLSAYKFMALFSEELPFLPFFGSVYDVALVLLRIACVTFVIFDKLRVSLPSPARASTLGTDLTACSYQRLPTRL